jgi:hypothetical protein
MLERLAAVCLLLLALLRHLGPQARLLCQL